MKIDKKFMEYQQSGKVVDGRIPDAPPWADDQDLHKRKTVQSYQHGGKRVGKDPVGRMPTADLVKRRTAQSYQQGGRPEAGAGSLEALEQRIQSLEKAMSEIMRAVQGR